MDNKNILPRFEIHAHTHYSNLRLIDSINKPETLVKKAIELGLSGIAITEHDSLSGSMVLNDLRKEIQKENPDFKLAIGNEIYLCDTRDSGQPYYHFILIAKNKDGHKALRELSSRAWLNSFSDRGMERVVTLKSDLVEILQKYPKSLIASTACLAGEFSHNLKLMVEAETVRDNNLKTESYQKIVNFLTFCKDLFQEDFYLECAPSQSEDQLKVNTRITKVAQAFNIPIVLGCDAHYLGQEDRYVHKAYLNSKEGEREVDFFYQYAYLQTQEEILENLKGTDLDYEKLVQTSLDIYNKIENYDLTHKAVIPRIKLPNYTPVNFKLNVEFFDSLLTCEDEQKRYWANTCASELKKLNIPAEKEQEYAERLEIEAKIIEFISNNLEDNLFCYFNTMKHNIDIFWECDSIVGPGRGSGVGFLSNYLLGITQLDPIEWELPYWRFLNEGRAELPDIDVDLAPSKRPMVLEKIKEERGGELGLTMIATFGTESAKSAILSAGRGYRSEEYLDGIDVDTTQYLSSLIPSERGFLWSLSDVVYGNEEKDRKPVDAFLREVKKYPGLLEVMLGIEGLISKRSSHAAGVILFDEDPYELGCFMKTKKGEIVTQYDLKSAEKAGMTKFDFLVTEITDKIITTLELLRADNVIEPLSLKELYYKYLHPTVLPIDSKDIWENLAGGNVLDVFQFNSAVGLQAAKKLKPGSPNEMADANSIMRLMGEKGHESPLERYARFKENISLWYSEMKKYGLKQEDMTLLEKYYKSSYGNPSMQEDLMMILMDSQIAKFTLEEANWARKIVAKKKMKEIPVLRDMIFTNMKDNVVLAKYIWDTAILPQLGYSFSRLHSLAYSFVGIQTLFLATKFNPLYWNTACLTVNSGSLDADNEKATDYSKLAKAIGDIKSRGINISLVDINKSDYSFYPNAENNTILFGLKGINGVGANVIQSIVANRPFLSFNDFINKINPSKTVVLALIKAGAFDLLEDKSRVELLSEYLWTTCGRKNILNLRNFNGLMKENVLPEELNFQERVFVFNAFLKKYCKQDKNYILNTNAVEFINEFFEDKNLIHSNNGSLYMVQKEWDKEYQSVMSVAKAYIQLNQKELLEKYNSILFKREWTKYAGRGNESF